VEWHLASLLEWLLGVYRPRTHQSAPDPAPGNGSGARLHQSIPQDGDWLRGRELAGAGPESEVVLPFAALVEAGEAGGASGIRP